MCCAVLCALALPAGADAGVTELVSVSTGGVHGNGPSFSPVMTPGGRYVAFESYASNLVPGDTNGFEDIFVRDLVLGTTERVDIADTGGQSNSASFEASISDDGRYVAYSSFASNLVPSDTNGSCDVFVRDRLLGTTTRVSVASSGAEALPAGDGAGSQDDLISGDGSAVAFLSEAPNLVAGDTNATDDIFVHELASGRTERVSVTNSGGQADGNFIGGFSTDGRYVVFDTLSGRDVFVRDRVAQTTSLVSVSMIGAPANGDSYVGAMSSDGRYLAFVSSATDLVPGASRGFQTYVRDRVLGTTQRVSVSTSGALANAITTARSVSPDGRYVALLSDATNLVPGDTNGVDDIFIRDVVTGTTVRANVSAQGGQANGRSYTASLGADDRTVAFDSLATNLFAGDRSSAWDVFLGDIDSGSAPPPAPTCQGAKPTILGTPGPDTLTGSPGDDVIKAFGGDDVISGGGGDDLICGDGGVDIVHAGDGADVVRGGRGHDQLFGDDGNDLLNGKWGNDILSGGPGDDMLSGRKGDDALNGDAGADTCYGGRGSDSQTGCETVYGIP